MLGASPLKCFSACYVGIGLMVHIIDILKSSDDYPCTCKCEGINFVM